MTSAAPPPLTKTGARLRRIKDLEKADVFRVNPVLGPYPAELEFVFPFSQTISDRTQPEASEKACAKRLRTMGYSKVVVAKSRDEGDGPVARRAPQE